MTAQLNTVELFGSIKSFSVKDGFGFIAPDPDNDTGTTTDDVLIKARCFRSSGYQTVLEGARIHCEAVENPHGLEAVSILDLDIRTATHPSQHPIPKHLAIEPESGWERAVVKWFDHVRGFGFLRLARGTADIFVHLETLQRYGLVYLEVGQEIEVRWGRNRFGFVAVQLRPYGYWPGSAFSH